MRQINLRLPDALVDAIDRVRGDMPRERLLRAIATRWFAYHRDDTVSAAADYVHEVELGYTLDAGVLRKLHDAVVVTDADERVRLWNAGAERVFGWSAAEAIGRPAWEVMNPQGTRRDEVERHQTAAEGHWRGTLQWWGKDGKSVTCEAVSQGVKDRNGELRGFAIVFREVGNTAM